MAKVKDMVWDKIEDAMAVREKHARSDALSAVSDGLIAELCGEGSEYAERKTKIKRVAAYVMPLRTTVLSEDADSSLALAEEGGEKAA